MSECAAVVERALPTWEALVRRHFAKASQAVAVAPLDDQERVGAYAWLDAAADLLRRGCLLEVRRHSALAIRAAKRLEDRRLHAVQVQWKNDLVVTSAEAPGPSRPSRLAYRWLRGNGGWQKSPVGPAWLNDAVAEDQKEAAEDECPAHQVEPAGRPSRVWRPSDDDRQEVLCDQADVEREAGEWASLWDEDAAYDLDVDPHGCRNLIPLRVWALQRAALTFPVGTGKGSDNVAPRAFARLSVSLLTALCVILMAAELDGRWPSIVDFVLIVLLPKTDGGRRPIGLFPALVRVWARARACAARAWEAQNARPYIFGGAGMGAQRAAWQAGFRAEAAALTGTAFAQSLLDLVKAFETIPHRPLVEAARRHGYSLWLLRMSLAAYRLQRTVGVDGCFSRLVRATRGITAGSCFATTELRVILLDVVDATYKRYLMIDLTLYVDDLTIAAAGPEQMVVPMVALATDTAVQQLEDVLGLTVSVKKSVAAACRPAIAMRVARTCRTRRLKAVRTTKMLGTPPEEAAGDMWPRLSLGSRPSG